MRENWELSLRLPMSQPYVDYRNCLAMIEKNDLQPKDFHVFEDGIEQKISNVAVELEPWTLERDMHNKPLASHLPDDERIEFHSIWSYGPRGIWRSPSLPYTYRLSASSSYLISYIPQKLTVGGCHKIKVTVDRRKAEVFATKEYCYLPHSVSDVWAGSEFGKYMESEIGSHFIDPQIPLSAQAGCFYRDPKTAKVDVVLQFPAEKLRSNWNGTLHGDIGVLGVAYSKQGVEVARFSDSAISAGNLMFGPDTRISALPSRYETQIDLPPGKYELRIALSDGSKFGRVIVPVEVAELKENVPTLSSLFLFKRFRNAEVAALEAQKINLAPAYVPLVSQYIQVTPTAEPIFKVKETVPVYFEVYESAIEKEQKPTIEVHMRLLDAATGEVKQTFPWFDAEPFRRPGTSTFAIHKFLYFGELAKGAYRLEAQAKDSAGNASEWRTTEFTVK